MLMNSIGNSLYSAVDVKCQKVALNPQFGSKNFDLWDLAAALTASRVSHKISGGLGVLYCSTNLFRLQSANPIKSEIKPLLKYFNGVCALIQVHTNFLFFFLVFSFFRLVLGILICNFHNFTGRTQTHTRTHKHSLNLIFTLDFYEARSTQKTLSLRTTNILRWFNFFEKFACDFNGWRCSFELRLRCHSR